MPTTLRIIAGPHFDYDRHDTFLVGRSGDAHLQLSFDDPYFSRRHFLFELQPPRCRVIDLNSRNGTFVNGVRIETAELQDGDEIKAGHTVFNISIPPPNPDEQLTFILPLSTTDDSGYTRVQPSKAGMIPGYDIEKEIGRGAMGIVYRAMRHIDRRVVAIKVIAPTADVNPREVHRFVRQAKLMAALDHPNVVRLLDAGTADPIIFIAMELVEGRDASQIVDAQGPLAVAVAVRVAVQMLAGLAHAHANGIVHRDIKPANILVGGPKGKKVAKLADFGLARLFDDCKLSGLTFQGEIGGTPAYMAPEQVTHFRDVKPAADQYSAAATLYNLLTAKYPHDLPREIGKQLAVIITEPLVPIRSRRPEIPGGLAAAIDRALAREANGRYASVEDFRRALLPFAK
jgi:eukaryotic-like serine/threonine-protein kinase